MKILHILNRCSIDNGVVQLLLSLIPYQISHGNTVDVVSLVDHPNNCCDRFIKLGCKYSYLSAANVNMKSPIFIIKIQSVLKNYDIVHAHLFPTFYWVSLAKMIFRLKCKLVFTEHATENNRRKIWMLPIERLIYKQYDSIIAISDAVANNLSRFLKCDIGVLTIKNGVDLKQFQNASSIKKELNISKDKIVLIQVAGFRKEKDQMTTIRALSLLPNQYHLLFVGDGGLKQKHMLICKELGLEERVSFLGARHDVPSLLKSSDIIVMSSHFEGFGLAAVEGMATSKPVIASDVLGLSEVVKDAGLLFTPQSEQELVKHILELSSNPEYYSFISTRCYKKAQQFNINNTAKEYLDVYNKLLDNNPSC